MKTIMIITLISLTIFLTFGSAIAWHRHARSHFGIIIAPPPILIGPPVIYYRGYYPPPSYYYSEPYRVWIPGHWEERWGPYGWERVWIPGHWRYDP